MVFFFTLYKANFGLDQSELSHNLDKLVSIIRTSLKPDGWNGQIGLSDEDEFFNQDTVRDNFTSIILLVEQLLDGASGPGGAMPNQFLMQDSSMPLLLETLKAGTRNFGYTQDMLVTSSQSA